mgnify:CR=1 FL=1
MPVRLRAAARIVASPAVFADPETGSLAGLWRGGDHGDETQETNRTDQCHDITVFPAGNLAAGACSGNGILFDISEPRAPKRIDAVTDTGFAYWHSATFNNDGNVVVFTDEWGGGSAPVLGMPDLPDPYHASDIIPDLAAFTAPSSASAATCARKRAAADFTESRGASGGTSRVSTDTVELALSRMRPVVMSR